MVKIFKEDEPTKFELAFGSLIISLAESLKLDIFIKWLAKKLNRLSNWQINVLAFTVVVAGMTIFFIIGKLTR